MIRVESVKRVLALLIAICLFLPIAQCTQKVVELGPTAVEKTKIEDWVPAQYLRLEAWDEALIVAAFLSPLAFIVVRGRIRGPKLLGWISAAEAVSTGYLLYVVGTVIWFWGTVRYGGVILVASAGSYLLLVLGTAYGCWRTTRRPSAVLRSPAPR